MSKYIDLLREVADRGLTKEDSTNILNLVSKDPTFLKKARSEGMIQAYVQEIINYKDQLTKPAANVEAKRLLSNDKEKSSSLKEMAGSLFTSAAFCLGLSMTKHGRGVRFMGGAVALCSAAAFMSLYDIKSYKERYTSMGLNNYFSSFMTSGRGLFQVLNNYLLPQTVFFSTVVLAKMHPLAAVGLAVSASALCYGPLNSVLEKKFLTHAADQRTYDRFYPNLDERTTAPGKAAFHMQQEFLPAFPNMMLLEASPDSEVPVFLRDFRSATFKDVKAMKEHGIVTDKNITSIPTMSPHPLLRQNTFNEYNTVSQSVQDLDVFFGLSKPVSIAPESRAVMLQEVEALYNKFHSQ